MRPARETESLAQGHQRERGSVGRAVGWADALIAQGEPALGRERLAVRMGWSLHGRSFQFQP